MKWIDISDILTDKAKAELKPGQVLIFRKNGIETHLQLKRRAKGKVWVEEVKLYHPDEVRVDE